MFDDSELLITVFLVFATSLVLWRSASQKANARSAIERNTKESWSRLSQKMSTYQSKVKILEEHTARYFNTMHHSPGGGLALVLEIQQELNKARESIEEYMSQKHFAEALEVIRYLDGDVIKPYKRLTTLTSANLNVLVDWEFIADRSILSICAALEKSSEKNAKIYTAAVQHQTASRARKPTLVSVHELREMIGAEK